MTNKSYTATIEVAQSAEEVFTDINDVTKWWSKDFQGNSTKPDDEFIINHPNQHYSKQKVIEFIPGKKVVWLVIESKLNWLKNNKQEWTNTKMIFDITTKGDKTVLHFTHEGLDAEKECYAMCEKGWNIYKGLALSPYHNWYAIRRNGQRNRNKKRHLERSNKNG